MRYANLHAMLAGILSVMLLVACAPQTGSALPADAARLVNVIWMWHRTERPDGTLITARYPAQHTLFSKPDGTVNGEYGCNRGSGTYTLTGSQLTIHRLTSSAMGCNNPTPLPPATPEPLQSGMFYSDIGSVERYAFEYGNLVFHLRANKGKMVFTSIAGPILTGKTWKASAYHVAQGEGMVSVLPWTEITATFWSNGNLTGNAGCNTYHLKYKTSAEIITVSQHFVTRMACDSPIMQQEQAYLDALQRATKYSIEGNRLRLINAYNREVVVFDIK